MAHTQLDTIRQATRDYLVSIKGTTPAPADVEEGILALTYIFRTKFPNMKKEALKQWCGLFLDLQLKADNSEITTKALDLRGMLGALNTIQCGLRPALAVKMGVVNKCFDIFEKEIVQDVVMTRIPESWRPEDVFE